MGEILVNIMTKRSRIRTFNVSIAVLEMGRYMPVSSRKAGGWAWG
jgi:hypothetical protein